MNLKHQKIIEQLRVPSSTLNNGGSQKCFDHTNFKGILKALGLNPKANMKQIYELKLNSDQEPNKPIPHILHQVWVGIPDSSGKVSLMSENYENNLLSNFAHFDESWRIYIWTNNIDSLPVSIKNHKQVEVRIYDQEFSELQRYFDVLSQNKGLLSLLANIVRARVLMEHGGVYFDADYKLCKKIDDLIEKYDFVIGRDSNKHFYGGNAFIAGHQNHPVVSEYYKMMINNFDKETASTVAINACHYINWRFLGFGPHALTFSFLKKSFDEDNKDVIVDTGILLDYRREPGYKVNSPDFCENLPAAYYGNDPMKGDWTGMGGQIETLGDLYTCLH